MVYTIYKAYFYIVFGSILLRYTFLIMMGPLLKSTSPPPVEGFDEDGGFSFVVLDPPSDTRDVGGGSIIVGRPAEFELFGWSAAWVDVSIELSGPLTILITGFTLISG